MTPLTAGINLSRNLLLDHFQEAEFSEEPEPVVVVVQARESSEETEVEQEVAEAAVETLEEVTKIQ